MADLPRAVQAQVEAANAMLAQANGAPEQGIGGNPVDLATLAQPKPAEPPKVEQPAPEVEVAPVVKQEPPKPEAWEAKYKTLQGLFNAEVPKLQGQVKELTARLNEAIGQIEKTNKQQQTQEQTKPSVDPKDVENFGSDLVDMVQRVAQQMLGNVATKVDGVVSGFEQRIASLERTLKSTSQTVAVTAEDSFFTRFAAAVPEWEQINSDERFLAWLGEVDPLLGQPRQVALTAAQQNLDVARTVAIFNAYKATLPKVETKTNPVGKQVSPSTTASVAPTPSEKPTVTQKQIVDFYDARRRGEFRGRDEEASRIEAFINSAIAEGRVV